MHDDGLQAQQQLEEAPLLVEVHDPVELDVITAAGEDPVLVDELLPGDGVDHLPHEDQGVTDLEREKQTQPKQDRPVRDGVQPAGDEKS